MAGYLKQFFIDLLQLMPVIELSALGGAVAYLNELIGIITAGFVGVVVHFFLQSADFHPGFKSAAVAISGYASRDVLQVWLAAVAEKLRGRVKRSPRR